MGRIKEFLIFTDKPSPSSAGVRLFAEKEYLTLGITCMICTRKALELKSVSQWVLLVVMLTTSNAFSFEFERYLSAEFGVGWSKDNDQLELYNNGTAIGFVSNHFDDRLRANISGNVEAVTDLGTDVNSDSPDHKPIRARLAHVGVRKGAFELIHGRQWTPFYNFLAMPSNTFLFSRATSLTNFDRLEDHSEMTSGNLSTVDTIDRATSLRIQAPETVLTTQRQLSLYGWEVQFAGNSEVYSAGAGFVTEGGRFSSAAQSLSFSYGYSRRKDGVERVSGVRINVLSSEGIELDVREVRNKSKYFIDSIVRAVQLRMHDLSRRIFYSDPSENLSRSSVGIIYSWSNTGHSELALGYGYDFSPHLRAAIELTRSTNNDDSSIGLVTSIEYAWDTSMPQQ